jgi:cytochrome d ubiquinol oxidase subunit II
MTFFTDFTPFSPEGRVGLLDWYTVSMALVVLVFLAAHGATYLALRTEGPVHDRSVKFMRRLWTILPGLVVIIGFETWIVRPALADGFLHKPLAWLFAVAVVVGAVMVYTGIRSGDEKRSFFGSGTVLVGMLAAGAATIYPTILHSTLAEQNSLTAQNTAASMSSLELAMVWWPIAGVMAFGYLWYIARYFSGKVDVHRDGTGPY